MSGNLRGRTCIGTLGVDGGIIRIIVYNDVDWIELAKGKVQ